MPERSEFMDVNNSNRSGTDRGTMAPSGTSSESSYGTSSGERGTISDVTEKAREIKDRVVDRASDQAQSMFDSQKSRATGALSSVATALRQTAETLQREDQSGAARYIDMAADRMADFAQTFEAKELNEVMVDVQDYARRNPAIFFGGTLALGFLAARFLKATAPRSSGFRAPTDYSYEHALYGNPASATSRTNRSANPGYGGTTSGSSGSMSSSSSSSSGARDSRTNTPAGLTYGEDL